MAVLSCGRLALLCSKVPYIRPRGHIDWLPCLGFILAFGFLSGLYLVLGQRFRAKVIYPGLLFLGCFYFLYFFDERCAVQKAFYLLLVCDIALFLYFMLVYFGLQKHFGGSFRKETQRMGRERKGKERKGKEPNYFVIFDIIFTAAFWYS